ncbi:S9 family peptidase [Erythrobacter sp. AP23]|uniref:S9 family peptidase n=1 Tax=Erythrobacter sp. AP23 TaxID=499656 RepID=UPI0018DB2221|nr:S9 family peptidase [Erythrobacter sp. AP23]
MKSLTAPVIVLAASTLAACATSYSPTGGGAGVAADVHSTSAAIPLVPRQVLFGNVDYGNVSIDPSGERLAYLKPVDGVLNVWVAPISAPDAGRPVTNDTERGIRQYYWSGDGSYLLYLQDAGGNENFQLMSVDVRGARPGTAVNLTDNPRVRTQVIQISHDHPGKILLGLNDRDPRYHDIYRVSLADGSRTLVFRNDGQFASVIADADLTVRLASLPKADGSVEHYRVTNGLPESDPFITISREQAYGASPLSIDDQNRLLFLDNRGGDLADLVAIPLGGGDRKVLVRARQADLSNILTEPGNGRPLAAFEEYDEGSWSAIDPAVADDFDKISREADGVFDITSTDRDAQKWIVSVRNSRQPRTYYLYDRASGSLDHLFSAKPELDDYVLAETKPVVIPSQDGLSLVSYLTIPPGSDADEDGRPDTPVPLVLDVHGGPYARDRAGFDPEHQWLANRGYAVLSINFRGSTGFGKAFQNAGDKEWAGKMHRDLLDGVDWAIAQGIADPDRVSVYGVSYGGYSALLAAAFTPDRFACNVDVVGPVNLVTLFQSTPPYWLAFRAQLMNRVGDPDNPEDVPYLLAASPISKVDTITKPLLVGQGANDPRVKKAEPDQLVAKARANGIPVTYIVYPDEGHGFARPENRLSFFAASEQFLAQCLGGRAEPFGDDLEGSSIVVEEGADLIDGLTEALARQ